MAPILGTLEKSRCHQEEIGQPAPTRLWALLTLRGDISYVHEDTTPLNVALLNGGPANFLIARSLRLESHSAPGRVLGVPRGRRSAGCGW